MPEIRHFSSGFESQRSCDMEVSVKKVLAGCPFAAIAVNGMDGNGLWAYGHNKIQKTVANL